jgi:hypothetical protein
VERGWDQVEGVIAPKARAGRRSVQLMAVVRDLLDRHLRKTGRSADGLVFGHTARQAFYPRRSMAGRSEPGRPRTSASARRPRARAARPTCSSRSAYIFAAARSRFC